MSFARCPRCGLQIKLVNLGNYGYVLEDHPCARNTSPEELERAAAAYDADELGLDPEDDDA